MIFGSPDGESTLHILLNVFGLRFPNSLDSFVFVPILILVRLETGSPEVEHAGKQLFVSEVRTKLFLLLKHLNRLERLLMPLLNRDLHLVFAEAVKHVDELLESAVALLIEAAVRKELVHRVLLPLQDHCVELLEHDFGH